MIQLQISDYEIEYLRWQYSNLKNYYFEWMNLKIDNKVKIFWKIINILNNKIANYIWWCSSFSCNKKKW